MNLRLALTAASVILSGTASAQATYYAENFDMYLSGTNVNSVPSWSSTGVTQPTVELHPVTGSQALEFDATNGPESAQLDMSNLPDAYILKFEIDSSADATFAIFATDGTNYQSRASLSIARVQGAMRVTSLESPMNFAPLGSPSTVEVQVYELGMYAVLVDGSQLHTGTWNTGTTPLTTELAEFRAVDANFSGPFTHVDNVRIEGFPSIGTNYCQAELNISGQAGVMSAEGVTVAAQNNVVLHADQIAPNQFGMFFVSTQQIFVPGVGNGNLCVNGPGRYDDPGQVQPTGAHGSMSLRIDLTQTPTLSGYTAITAGQTWSFQCWFRDPVGAGYNLTDGLQIDFN